MQLFDAPPGKDEPTELAPAQTVERRDGFSLTWHFAGDEAPLMVCLYDGSGTYYRARPQQLPASCTMRNDNGLTQAWCEEP